MHSSANVYSSLTLHVYDFIVLWISNLYVWHCSTTQYLLPFFKAHQGSEHHLDVGVGTGYYPARAFAHSKMPKSVSFLDLNPNTLRFVEQRLRRAGYEGMIETYKHDVFEPIPQSMNGEYDSVSLFYLFHCLPGSFPQKATRVFKQLIPALNETGTLYGATILGKGVQHNWLGRLLLRVYNGKGIFCNNGDGLEGLTEALNQCFRDVEVKQVGVVALFVARTPY